MIQKYERKTDRRKISPDIILEAIRAVKIHNLSIQQAALKFNTNYHVVIAKKS